MVSVTSKFPTADDLASFMDDLACMPGGARDLRDTAIVWSDVACDTSGLDSQIASEIADALIWRSLGIINRQIGQIESALKFEQYAEEQLARLRKLLAARPKPYTNSNNY